MENIAFAPGMRGLKSRRRSFVLDASTALTWYFENEQNRYADKVRLAMSSTTTVVPFIWGLEITNTLLAGERSGRASKSSMFQFLRLMDAFSIIIDDEGWEHSFGNIFVLAHNYQLTTYDAAYLELSLRQRLPLATLDKELKAAAKKAGVKLYKP